MNNANNENKRKYHKTSIGGQALIEGIMMQGPKCAAMSVRLPDGTVETEELEVKHLRDKFKPAGFPLIRGIVNFVESMVFGFKCMEKMNELGFITKSIIVKNIEGNEKTKGKDANLWRWRALAGGFSIFKHEYIMIMQKV